MIAYYIKLDTQEYPFYLGDLHNMHPEFNGGQPDPTLYGAVQSTDAPRVEAHQTFDELKPKCVDGVWQQVFVVRAKTDIEIASEQLELQKTEQQRIAYEQRLQQASTQTSNTNQTQIIDAPSFVIESVRL